MPLILIIGAIVIAIGAGALFMIPKNDTTTPVPETETAARTETSSEADTEATTPTDTMVAPEETTTSDTTSVANGTYNAKGTYLTPKRTEHAVEVTLTVEDGMVTESVVLFDNKPAGESSNPNQVNFYESYTSEVVGQPLETISLSRVGGASLTTNAFNDAVAIILAEARG
jgi:hypothetical protein